MHSYFYSCKFLTVAYKCEEFPPISVFLDKVCFQHLVTPNLFSNLFISIPTIFSDISRLSLRDLSAKVSIHNLSVRRSILDSTKDYHDRKRRVGLVKMSRTVISSKFSQNLRKWQLKPGRLSLIFASKLLEPTKCRYLDLWGTSKRKMQQWTLILSSIRRSWLIQVLLETTIVSIAKSSESKKEEKRYGILNNLLTPAAVNFIFLLYAFHSIIGRLLSLSSGG